ncbi:uncharacterized protein ACR2FA_004288 [Aphomia sociella]
MPLGQQASMRIYYEAGSGSCKTTTDVDKAYTSLRELYFECYNEAEFHAFFNESVILRNDYFKHAFSKEKIKEFYDNDGSQCVNSMRSDIEQCVNKTLNIKKPFIKNITYSLIRITKPLHFNKRTCGNSANIKKCILDIPINDCNATKQFIAYLHDYIANKYCKKDIDKPTASKYSGTGVTIGVLFAVIAILAIAFVIYKRRHNIFRKKGAPKEGQDACSYNVAQETVTT